MNSVNLIGRIGRICKDIELRYTKSSKAYCFISLALLSNRKSEDGSLVKHADWITVKVFGKLAENCANYLQKGSQISIEARLSANNYIDKDGKEIYGIDTIANKIEFTGSRDSGDDNSQQDQKLSEYNKQANEFSTSDVPF